MIPVDLGNLWTLKPGGGYMLASRVIPAPVALTATVESSSKITIRWTPASRIYIKRDGTDVNGGGEWGTWNATGVQDFAYLRAGTAYTFTATTEAGAVSTVTATTTPVDASPPQTSGVVYADASPAVSTATAWVVPATTTGEITIIEKAV